MLLLHFIRFYQLYDDDCLIESQIRDNCHAFAHQGFGYDAEQSEELHRQYGSTIRGICELGRPRSTFLDYYNDVYPGIDMSWLRKYSSGAVGTSTGYSSGEHLAMRASFDTLHNFDCPVVVASNSPVFHVKRVLTRLGLANLKVASFITPERRGGITKNEPSFWDPLFELYPRDQYSCCLIDDNSLNVALVRTLGMRALRITPKMRLPETLVHFLDVLPTHPTERNDTRPEDEPWFDFDDQAYLEAKSQVDKESFSAPVREDLVRALRTRLEGKINAQLHVQSVHVAREETTIALTVVDVGAGLLSMLDHVHKMVLDAVTMANSDRGSGSDSGSDSESGSDSDRENSGVKVHLHYIAFESNQNLHTAVAETLQRRYGLAPSTSSTSSGSSNSDNNALQTFHGQLSPQVEATVHLSGANFMSSAALHTLAHLLSIGATGRAAAATAATASVTATATIATIETIDTTAAETTSASAPTAAPTPAPTPAPTAAPAVNVNDPPQQAGTGKRRYCRPMADAEAPFAAAHCLSLDLIVGCHVADLVSPAAFAAQLTEMACDDGPLLYLPLVFAGRTKLLRGAAPAVAASAAAGLRTGAVAGAGAVAGTGSDASASATSGVGRAESGVGGGVGGARSLPPVSDAEVFRSYHAHLTAQGHHLQPDAPYPHGLLSTLGRYGCTVLSRGASDHVISRSTHPHMWRCMVRFVAMGTAVANVDKWDMKGWFDDLLLEGPGHDTTFVASNLDLLGVFPRIVERLSSPGEPADTHVVCFAAPPSADLCATPSTAPPEVLANDAAAARPARTGDKGLPVPVPVPVPVPATRRAVEFTAPRQVHVVEEPVPAPGKGQLLLRTLCSLVSTGTEIKVYQGDVDSDQPADLTIASMQGAKMGYPMRYGYSLVGEVVAVGEGVQEDWVGQTVFSFSPHASAVVVDAAGVLRVPADVSPEDAAFLPSVETAVSLVQAAKPILGDRVLVVGQGLIGLLTGAVLQQLTHAEVTVADVSDQRLAVSAAFTPNVIVWNPSALPDPHRPHHPQPPFDVSIEVSGNPKGLQTAIDHTGAYGKVVVGSLFGEGLSALRLGLKFHRSGVRLLTSQVSHIPPELSGRWDKQRRFDVAWRVLRAIRPSRLLTPPASSGGAGGEGRASAVPLRSADVRRTYEMLERGDLVTALFEDRD